MSIGLTDAIREILKNRQDGLTPQEVKNIVKDEYGHLYNTQSHQKNVEKGNYKDVDHALLAQIYTASMVATDICMDRSTKPLKLTLCNTEEHDEDDVVAGVSSDDMQSIIEVGRGCLYILDTGTYTKDQKQIVKIGITYGDIKNRLDQLYTTNSPYRYSIIEKYDVFNPEYLEKAVHSILFKFRVNKDREFFVGDCIPIVGKIVEIYEKSCA